MHKSVMQVIHHCKGLAFTCFELVFKLPLLEPLLYSRMFKAAPPIWSTMCVPVAHGLQCSNSIVFMNELHFFDVGVASIRKMDRHLHRKHPIIHIWNY